MEVYLNPARERWPEILSRPEEDDRTLKSTVEGLLERVRTEGDSALLDLTWKLDGVRVPALKVSKQEVTDAVKNVPRTLKAAIALARQNIEKFHDAQRTEDVHVVTAPGVECWTRTLGIDRVGLYVPGGSAPLFSTVLMLGVPARLAGCREIVLCTPPGPDGKVHPTVLHCAENLGIEEIYRVGGAQAIAAMAYGTESVPRVDKIFGPGNRYVTLAKQLVSHDKVAIDLPAGPSEVAIMADQTADPALVAADLIAQAEHGPDSQVLLVSQDGGLIPKVQQELDRQLRDLPRREPAAKSLKNSRIVLLDTREEVIDLINEYAPEHLIIACRDYAEAGSRIRNAGSVFLGELTPESAGDYASGTNHTLPTGGYAKAFGGLSLADFQKRISFQEINAEGLRNLGPAIVAMAMEEALAGHAKAVEMRLSKISDNKY